MMNDKVEGKKERNVFSRSLWSLPLLRSFLFFSIHLRLSLPPSQPAPPLRIVFVAAVPLLRGSPIVVLGVELVVGSAAPVAAAAAAAAAALLLAAPPSLGDHPPPVLLELPPEQHQLPSRRQPGGGEGEAEGGAVAADEGGIPVGVEAVEAVHFFFFFLKEREREEEK